MAWQRTLFTCLAMFPRLLHTPLTFTAVPINSAILRRTLITLEAMLVCFNYPIITVRTKFVKSFW